MNSLDSPFEALALNHLSYDVVSVIANNIWTWIAVLTAGALGSFLIKARADNNSYYSSNNNNSCTRESSKNVLSSSTTTTNDEAISSATEFLEGGTTRNFIPNEKIAERLFPDTRAVESGGGVSRGKFVVYYNDEEDEERENVRESQEPEERDDAGLVNGEGDLEWRERIGEWKMGWYRYQDLTLLHGNVVRLWEGNRKINVSFI